MAFVLQDVIEELARSHSLDQLQKLKKENLAKFAALEFEHEEQRLACEEAQRAGEEAQKARDAEKALQDAQLAAQHEEAQRV